MAVAVASAATAAVAAATNASDDIAAIVAARARTPDGDARMPRLQLHVLRTENPLKAWTGDTLHNVQRLR